MGFEDLDHKIKNYLVKESGSIDKGQKARIKEDVLVAYSVKKSSLFTKFKDFVFEGKYTNIVSTSVIIALLVGFMPLISNQSYAGEITSDTGLVEIIRDGEKTILAGKSKLKIGDEILVNNNATAKLSLRNDFQSEVFENSKIKIVGRDELFLAQGKLNNEFNIGKVSTNKGEILAKKNSIVAVYVTDSGETRITPQRNSIMVRNWQGEEIELTAGEELRLRTDTSLSSPEINNGLNLSSIQIQAIRAKLFIARTKALNYVENIINKEFKKASSDLDSAEKTFKSIAQVLKNSREMGALAYRENIDMLENKEIYNRLEKRTNDSDLLASVGAVEELLDLVKARKNFNFSSFHTDVLSFNRYVLISRLFAQESEESQELGNILRQQYVLSFAKKIFNEELRIDQISVLNTEIKKLPKNSIIARFFLVQVKEMLTPELQSLLSEKIKKDFN